MYRLKVLAAHKPPGTNACNHNLPWNPPKPASSPSRPSMPCRRLEHLVDHHGRTFALFPSAHKRGGEGSGRSCLGPFPGTHALADRLTETQGGVACLHDRDETRMTVGGIPGVGVVDSAHGWYIGQVEESGLGGMVVVVVVVGVVG